MLALGRYPDVSLAQARDRRDEARKLIADGVDPVAEKRSAREKLRSAAEETFEIIARGWFAKFRPNCTAGHNCPDQWRLAIVTVDRVAEEPVCIAHPFTREPQFGETSANFKIGDLVRMFRSGTQHVAAPQEV